jgi:hypothetical protein
MRLNVLRSYVNRLYALLPVLGVATATGAPAAPASMQAVRRKTLRRPTVHDTEGPFIFHLSNPKTLKKRLKPV